MAFAAFKTVIDFLPPQFYVVFSRALQAAALPVVAALIATSQSLGGEIENAISFCNLLFVGNLCASLVALTTFGPKTIWSNIRVFPKKLYLELLIFSSFSALLAALIYTSLNTTTVTNAVLLARLGPVLFVVGSAILIAQPINKAEWLGFSLIGFGVIGTVFTGSGFEVVQGDLLIIASAFVYAIVSIMSKQLLPKTGMAALIFIRNLFSSIIFFLIAIVLYGPEHFMHAFYGPLWGIMMIYALVIIVISQFAWYKGIAALTPASVARWTIMTPALAVAYAYFINGENPSTIQLTALGFVTFGIFVSNIGKFTPRGASDSAENSVAAS